MSFVPPPLPGTKISKLWFDDIRPAPDETWVWARTLQAGKDVLQHFEIDECSLDHDLGLHDIEEAAIEADPELLFGRGVASETGLDLVHWMIEHKRVPPVVRVHSWNPEGARNMANALNRHGYDCVIDAYKVRR